MTNILSEEISGLGDGCVEGVVDGEDLGKVGGDGDSRRGHEEHLVIQPTVLSFLACLDLKYRDDNCDHCCEYIRIQ